MLCIALDCIFLVCILWLINKHLKKLFIRHAFSRAAATSHVLLNHVEFQLKYISQISVLSINIWNYLIHTLSPNWLFHSFLGYLSNIPRAVLGSHYLGVPVQWGLKRGISMTMTMTIFFILMASTSCEAWENIHMYTCNATNSEQRR